MKPVYYLAVDIGASSGRHILASMDNGRMVLEEVYRFENGMVNTGGKSCGMLINFMKIFLKV